jgi:hypothetical protein
MAFPTSKKPGIAPGAPVEAAGLKLPGIPYPKRKGGLPKLKRKSTKIRGYS